MRGVGGKGGGRHGCGGVGEVRRKWCGCGGGMGAGEVVGGGGGGSGEEATKTSESGGFGS